MTNWEKYKDELGVIDFAVDKKTHKPVKCTGFDCINCLFDGACMNCKYGEASLGWLNAEYEPPKDHIEIATLISYLKQEPNQMKQVRTIKIVDGMPVINGGE